KRLFAIVGIGSSTGAIFGAAVARKLFDPIGPYPMMLITGVLLGVSLALTNWVHRRERRTVGAVSDRAHLPAIKNARSETAPTAPIGGKGAFQLIFSSQYLLCIAILV